MPRALMLVSAWAGPELRGQVAAGERPRPEFLQLEEEFGVELLDWSRIGGVGRRTPWSSGRHALAALAMAGRFDVVFSDGEHLGIPVALGLRLLRRDTAHVVLGHHVTTTVKAHLFRWLGTSGGPDRVLFHSRRHLIGGMNALRLPRTRVRLLPFYVDTEFWRPLGLPEEALVLAPGREHRDHRTLAAACAGMQARVFVTGTSAHSAGAQVASPESWPANFEFGRPDYGGLRELYDRARVVVVPLLPADFPAGVTSILEAMAMGKAVVVSATSGRADELRNGENCVLVPAERPAALREAIQRLLDDADERQRLGRGALATARGMTLDRYVARLASHLREAGPAPVSGARVRREATATSGPAAQGHGVIDAAPPRRRVLLVTPELPYPPDWGFATRVYQLVRRLAAGHDVTVVAFAGRRDEEARRELSRYCRAIHTVEAGVLDTRSKRRAQLASLLSRRSYQHRRHTAPGMQRLLDDLLSRERFDLIQVESSLMGHLRFDSDAALLLDEHNIEYELLYRMYRSESTPLRKLFNMVEHFKVRGEERAVWRRFGACLVTSEREELIVRRNLPWVRTCVIANGVDAGYFAPLDVTRKQDMIVFTGAVNYRPNADAVAFFGQEVLPLIRARRPDARLVVVGHCGREDASRLARPGVTFTGSVPDVRPYLSAAALAVAPLRMGSGTRLKVLETMAMARAMVSTTIGCEGLHVVDGKHLLVADDAETFAERALELLDNPEASRAIGCRGRKLVESQYGWDTIVERLDRFQGELVAEILA